MFIETNVDFVRGVASWKPVTDKGGKYLPALGAVSFTVEEDKVTVAVTDRYRIVYAVIVGDFSDSVGETLVVPMEVFTRFTNGAKGLNGGLSVSIGIKDNEVTIRSDSFTVVEGVVSVAYPKIVSLVNDWEQGDTTGELFVDMVLLGEVVKLTNPFERQVTVGKRNNAWRVLRGKSVTVGREGALRLDRGVPERFGVIVQPRMSLRA